MENVLPVEEAIPMLFRLFANDVYRYALSATNQAEVAYTMVQQVYLTATATWQRHLDAADTKPWLLHLAAERLAAASLPTIAIEEVAADVEMDATRQYDILRVVEQACVRQGQRFSYRRPATILSQLGNFAAGLAAVLIVGGGTLLAWQTRPKPSVDNSANTTNTVLPTPVQPTSVSHDILGNTEIYRGSAADNAIQQFAHFRVIAPYQPSNFSTYQFEFDITQPKHGAQEQVALFTTIFVGSGSVRLSNSQLYADLMTTKNWQLYTVGEYGNSVVGQGNSLPHLRDVQFDGQTIRIQSNTAHTMNFYTFETSQRAFYIDFSAGDNHEAVNPLTDNTAWHIIASLLKAPRYLN